MYQLVIEAAEYILHEKDLKRQGLAPLEFSDSDEWSMTSESIDRLKEVINNLFHEWPAESFVSIPVSAKYAERGLIAEWKVILFENDWPGDEYEITISEVR